MSDLQSAEARPTASSNQSSVTSGEAGIRPRARLLRTIGAELISSEVVAVIELVRNSYDADAKVVDLVFTSPESPSTATLELLDDGHGMNREVLLGPWLEPATDFKTGTRTGIAGDRSPSGRRRLGSKGVGRFAAQRLGTHLVLRTRMRGNPELMARFNWTALEQDQYLDEVRIPWSEHSTGEIDGNGTSLRITELRDVWDAGRFEKLRLGLSRLISPTMREQFRIRLSINGAVQEVKPSLDAQQSMYSVEGELAVGGDCTIVYQDMNGVEERWERQVFWPGGEHQSAGGMSFKIKAWDLDREPLLRFLKATDSKLGLRDFRKAIRDHSGISLYRDGFRILPYGEPDNDWLRLDRRRVNNPTMRLSNNQILGVVQLTADDNGALRDQTNREGLVTNEAYQHLQEIVLEVLGYLETRRFVARRASGVDWNRKSSSLPALTKTEADDRVGQLFEEVRLANDAAPQALAELEHAFDEFRDATAGAVRHYASLASVGQMSGLVFRQLRHPIRQVRSELNLVADDVERAAAGELDLEDLEDLQESVARALHFIKRMERRMDKLDPLAVGGRGRRVSDHAVFPVLNEVLEAYSDEFDRMGVALDFSGDGEVALKMNRDIVQQVLANLVDNAIHFSKLGSAKTPTVIVRVTPNGFVVSDNGPGIAASIVASVFEPHFTDRADNSHGMGLTLVRDLLKTIGGSVTLEEPENAMFRVTLA